MSSCRTTSSTCECVGLTLTGGDVAKIEKARIVSNSVDFSFVCVDLLSDLIKRTSRSLAVVVQPGHLGPLVAETEDGSSA